MSESREQLQRNQQALQELTRLLGRSERAFEDTVEAVLSLGCQYLDLDIGFLSVIDAADDYFEVAHATGDHPRIQPGSTAELRETYCRRTFGEDGLMVVDDAHAEGWENDSAYERFGLACYLGGTVTVDGTPHGTLCFASDERRDRMFSTAESAFVELIVEWIGDEIERQNQQAALDTERQFVEKVFDALEDAVFVLDTAGRLKRWNAEVNAVTGYNDETLSGMDVRDLFDGRTSGDIDEAVGEVVEHGQTTIEAQVKGADGNSIPFEFRASLLTGPDGTATGICGVGRNITARRAREQRLRQYERAIENVRGMVYVLDDSGRITLVTPGLADRVGRDRDTLVGTHVREIFGDPTVATSEADTETTLQTGEDRTLPVQVEVTSSADGSVVGTVQDMSALAAAREKLDEERSRFQYLFDTIPDPVSDVRFENSEPIIQAVNETFEDVFGYDAEELVGRSANDMIVPPDAEAQARAVDERVLRQGATTVEIRRETDVGLRDFLFRGIPYDGEDAVRGFGIYTDITDQKRRARYLKILARIVRHNLRNKLDVIMGNAEWLGRDLTGDDYRRVELIIDAATDLESLSATAQQIERLLDQSGVRNTTVDAVEMVAMARARTFFDGEVLVEAPETLPIQADERLVVALRELIENASQHGGDDPTVRITVNPAGADGWATIAVADDGPGIPETERWVLTGEVEITQLSHSRGLGLWLVKWIVESFGGDIDITTSEIGSVVTIRLKQVSGEDGP